MLESYLWRFRPSGQYSEIKKSSGQAALLGVGDDEQHGPRITPVIT